MTNINPLYERSLSTSPSSHSDPATAAYHHHHHRQPLRAGTAIKSSRYSNRAREREEGGRRARRKSHVNSHRYPRVYRGDTSCRRFVARAHLSPACIAQPLPPSTNSSEPFSTFSRIQRAFRRDRREGEAGSSPPKYERARD